MLDLNRKHKDKIPVLNLAKVQMLSDSEEGEEDEPEPEPEENKVPVDSVSDDDDENIVQILCMLQ